MREGGFDRLPPGDGNIARPALGVTPPGMPLDRGVRANVCASKGWRAGAARGSQANHAPVLEDQAVPST